MTAKPSIKQRAVTGALSVPSRACTPPAHRSCTRVVPRIVVVLAVPTLFGCMPPRPPPQPPAPYVPQYSYKTTAPASAPVDVTVAIVNPVVKGRVQEPDGAEMLKALPTAIADLVTAKGMKYRGPFDQLDTLTFPDKKGSDLALYAEVEVDAGWTPANSRQEQSTNYLTSSVSFTQVCDIAIKTKGRVSFVVVEPMTGESLWRKTVQIPESTKTVAPVKGTMCLTSPVLGIEKTDPNQETEVNNTYRKELEAVFQATMKGIDAYMNAEEFGVLKGQSQELREKKVY